MFSLLVWTCIGLAEVHKTEGKRYEAEVNVEEQGSWCGRSQSTLITPCWGALALQSLCFREDVNPCPILVVPFYFHNFCYLGLTDLFCSAFRGRFSHRYSFSSTVFQRNEEFLVLFFPDFFLLMSTLKSCSPPFFLCVGDGFVPLFFIIAKTIWNWKWLMVSLLHRWFWQEIVNTRAVLTLLLRSAAMVLE